MRRLPKARPGGSPPGSGTFAGRTGGINLMVVLLQASRTPRRQTSSPNLWNRHLSSSRCRIRVVTGLGTSIGYCEPIEDVFPNEVKIAEAVSVFSKHVVAA